MPEQVKQRAGCMVGDRPKRLLLDRLADDARLGEHQRRIAFRVAEVSEREFVAQVESETPPTATAQSPPADCWITPLARSRVRPVSS